MPLATPQLQLAAAGAALLAAARCFVASSRARDTAEAQAAASTSARALAAQATQRAFGRWGGCVRRRLVQQHRLFLAQAGRRGEAPTATEPQTRGGAAAKKKPSAAGARDAALPPCLLRAAAGVHTDSHPRMCLQ